MPPVAPVSRYARVAFAAWDCVTAAGDAEASWRACRAGVSALTHDAAHGWVGRCGRGGIVDLAVAAAAKPWRAIADEGGAIAFGCADSKGDVAALGAALAGDATRFAHAWPGVVGARVAARLGVGVHLPCATAAACSTGLYAVLAAADLVERGAATRALVGAADASLTPWLLAGFAALGVTCGATPPRAFAGAGTGFAPAEGAGLVALGDRGPWRLVAGVRLGDARHETRFADPATLSAALRALWSVAPEPESIVTHGTGTALGDAYELAALDDGPWRDAPRLACKPTIGHCLGASGAVELAIALNAPARRVWKIGLGFGGHLAALAIDRA